MRGARAVWVFDYVGSGWRQLLATGLLAACVCAVAACGSPVTGGGPTPTPATGKGPSSVYFAGGAVNAGNGSTRWTHDLGTRPPIVSGGVLYAVAQLTTAQNQQTYGVEAVRASDGKVLWTYAGAVAEGSLALAGDRLIVPAARVPLNQPGTLTLVALRTSDGSVLWESAPIAAVRAPTVDTPVPVISNLVVSNGLVVGMAASGRSDSYIAAWRLSDGALAWKQSLANAGAFAGPSGTISITGATLTIAYQGASGELIVGLDPATGKSVWPAPVTAASLDLVTTNVAIISDSAAATVTGVRISDGTTLWQRGLGPSASRRLDKLAASDSTIFYLHFEPCQSQVCPAIYAISLADGSVSWHRALSPTNPDFATSAVYGDGMLYYEFFYQDASGTHFVLTALRAANGTTAWTHQIEPTLLDRAVVTNGIMYAIGRGSSSTCPIAIEALRDQAGTLVWRHDYAPCPIFPFAGPWLLVG